MQCNAPTVEHTMWFHRDLRWRNALAIVDSRKSITLSEDMDNMVERIRKRRETKQSSGGDSSSRADAELEPPQK
jgi:hypothetical protein